MFPDGEDNAMVTFTRREPNTQLIAALNGRADDRLTTQQQPASCSSQKQERSLPQKRGIYSTFDNSEERLFAQTTAVPADNKFRNQVSDG